MIAYPIHHFLRHVPGLLEVVIWASFAGRTPTIDRSEVPSSPALKALSRRRSSTMLAMTFVETPCASRGFLTLLQMRRTTSESGSRLPSFSPIAISKNLRYRRHPAPDES